jgi:hypothetical protein
MKKILAIVALGVALVGGSMDAQAVCPKFDTPDAKTNATDSMLFFNSLSSAEVKPVAKDEIATRTHKITPKAEGKLGQQPLPHRKVVGGILKFDQTKSTQKRKCCYQYAPRKRDVSKAAECGKTRVCFCAEEIVMKVAEKKPEVKKAAVKKPSEADALLQRGVDLAAKSKNPQSIDEMIALADELIGLEADIARAEGALKVN